MEQQHIHEPRKRTLLIIILISLLLHFLLGSFLLFWTQYDKISDFKILQVFEAVKEMVQPKDNAQKPPTPLPMQLPPQPQQEEWVGGQARGGGAPVSLHSPPDIQEDIDHSHAGEEGIEEISTQAQEIAAEPAILPKADEQKNKDTEIKKEDDIEKKAEDLKLIQESQTSTTIISEMAEPKLVKAHEEIAESTSEKKEEEKKEKTEKIADTIQKNASTDTKKVEEPKKLKTKTKKGKKISLAQITAGLQQKFNANSEHLVSVLSNKSGMPSDKQIKYEQYVQKLFRCVQNSERIHHDRLNPPEPYLEVDLAVTLSRDGKLINLSIVRSSGSRHVDDFVMMIYRDASSAFPPVPKYIDDNPFAIGIKQIITRQVM